MKYIKLFENWTQESILEGVSYPSTTSITQVVRDKLYTKLKKGGMTSNEQSKLWDELLYKDIETFTQEFILRKKPGSLYINAPFYVEDEYLDYQDIVKEIWGPNFAKRLINKNGWESIKNKSNQDLLKSIKEMIKGGKVYELINGSPKIETREEKKFINALSLLNQTATPEQIQKEELTNRGPNIPPALLLHFKEQFENETSRFILKPLVRYNIQYSDDFRRSMAPKFNNIVTITDDRDYRRLFWEYVYYYCSYYIAYYLYDYILTAMAECLLNLYKSMVADENKQINAPVNTVPNTSSPSNTTPKKYKSPNRVKPNPSDAPSNYQYVSNT